MLWDESLSCVVWDKQSIYRISQVQYQVQYDTYTVMYFAERVV